MTVRLRDPSPADGLGPALAASRARLGLVACLLVLAGLGWWWTLEQMSAMDTGPWMALGATGAFLTVWVVMMAAMMFPSVAPTVALYATMSASRLRAGLFTGGYLLTWAGVGGLAVVLAAGLRVLPGGPVTWDGAGRWLTAGTLLLAAAYELTPWKDVCLGKCRSPLGTLLGGWRDGARGALSMGLRNGAWCVGCCWALMASLFALGVMSVGWMLVVAGLILLEKVLPWRRVATYGVAGVLAALGLLVLLAPSALPGLTAPASPMPMSSGSAPGSVASAR